MNMKETFSNLVRDIKQTENYVPRDYQTMGGMWTVDTWKKDNLKVQVMDEGYTTKLSLMDGDNILWSVVDGVRKMELEGVTEDEFVKIFSNSTKKRKTM